MPSAMVNFVGTTTYAQIVLFAKEQLSANDTQVSLFYSAGSLGIVVVSLLGGFIIGWTKNVVLVYAVIGALTFLIPLCFSFTALGHAERYLPKKEEVGEQVASANAR